MTTFLLLLACAKLPETHRNLAAAELESSLAADGLSLAPPQLVADMPAPPLPALAPPGEIQKRLLEGTEHLGAPTVLDPAVPEIASFLRNDFVGVVRFGGGLVRMGDSAAEVRARTIELHLGAELRQQGRDWLSATTNALLGEAKLPAAASSTGGPPVLRAAVRGSNELDGRDNLNLPRTQVSPAPLEPASSGPRWLLVPYLRSYYAHNGGWFVGQEWGCSGGARVEVMLVLYDQRSGQPAWWQVATGRHIESMKAQPSRAQLDQFLLDAEDEVEAQLARGFLR
jgi:hypothetical protein